MMRRSPSGHLLSLILALTSTAALAGCGDDAGSADEAADEGGDATGPGGDGSGGFGSSGTTTGIGSGGAGMGSVGAGTGSVGAGEPPPVPPPEDEEPEDVTCDQLDPSKALVLYVSADDSNSMASPAEAREAISAGQLPTSVRTYEFLNYYDVALPAPAYPDVGLVAQAEPGDVEGTFDLLLAVRAHDAVAPRRPITMTLVVDTSGSMEGSPIARARAAMRAISSQLRADDVVNVLTWNDGDNVALEGHRVDGPDDPVLEDVIRSMVAGGGTDLHGGLVAGYELAEAHFGEGRLNRVVLISDGGANIGLTDEELIGAHAEDADGEGIYMLGVGTGPLGFYTDHLMDRVTDLGRGAYVYLDSEEEAERVLADRFDEVMDVAARAVQVEVTLPWYFQMKAFYGEEWSEDPAEVEPQHLAPGDATVILQTLRACSPDVVRPEDPVRLRATWETPIARQPRERVLETTLGELLGGGRSQLAEAEAIVAYAEALKVGSVEALSAALDKVEALGEEDADLAEIADLLRRHPSMN